VAKTRVVLTCGACRQQVSRWVGRCPGCGAWGTIEEAAAADGNARRLVSAPLVGGERDGADRRVRTGFDDVDRVLGGGLVPASVSLLAGEPGIGKSTLLLHLVSHLASQGLDCLLVSGEESHEQVAARARRLGIPGDAVRFAAGRELEQRGSGLL
jgi:DNA repair protein RadA/Sms